ncbi:hypothetical protein L1049_004806 [Liquidambar formosana]|uniref:SnoaL-like domain-containing protein n=1 Tax=Liquidambar formosana TaxID=63359 RepID=A0AAP0RTM5_LIQFO
MAVAAGFSGQVLQWNLWSKKLAGLNGSFPPKRKCQVEQYKMKIEMQQHYVCTKRRAKNKPFAAGRSCLVMSTMGNSNFGLSPLPLSETIMQFYTCINEKNLNQLSEFITDDCFFDDFSFLKPFQGKKEVMHFFEQLTASMGQNVKFSIGHVWCGDEFTAAVYWHLEWKKRHIPFTRGCSFYECAKDEERLTIKKAQAVIESPIKPGIFALTLLKIVTTLFDEFPNATEWFLKSPQTAKALGE